MGRQEPGAVVLRRVRRLQACSKPEHRANWFRDFGEVLAENRIGWAVWGWDEGFGLDRKMVNGKPVVDTVVAQALGLKTA